MQLLLFSALFLLRLCSVIALTTFTQHQITFNELPVCPRNDSATQLTKMEGAQDMRSCFVACAANASCSVLHRTNGICYFGTSNQLTQLFNQSVPQSSDPCVSYTRVPAALVPKLVVFFDFRQGFSNLISPGMFDATPNFVSWDSRGVYFSGSNASFIEVDTRGGSLISSYLDHPRNFSFYAKVVRQAPAAYQRSYHYFYDCSSTESAGRFGESEGRAWVEHSFGGNETQTRQSNSTPFAADKASQAVSLGAVFYGKTMNNFYLNGTDLLAEEDLKWPLKPAPRCLRLGFDPESEGALNGRMICYAIAKAALSADEFQQLDRMCSW